MAADKSGSDETDLVEVGDLPAEDDVTEARRPPSGSGADLSDDAPTEHDSDDPFAIQMAAPEPGQTTIASLRERLAAFLVDLGVIWLLYWGCLAVFHKITLRTWIGPVPTFGNPALLFHGIFLLIAFLYFFLLEAAFFATIGKFFCWMYVRRKDGRHAGALGIFIRNFFRLIELATAGLLTWVPMELTRRHQRLGDMAAGTIVIKKHGADVRHYPLDGNRLASAFGRSVALVIDLALALVWLLGYVMLINYQSTILGQWLVLLFPVLCVLFWTLMQFIMETTPGLWLLGHTITHEDGGRLTFAGALLRVLVAPLDLVLGLPGMLLSLRRQKVGDWLAATVVSRQHRRWKGAIGALVVVAVSVGLVALGLFTNPVNNIFRAGPDFKLSFMPVVEGLPTWESSKLAEPPVLTLRNFRFGVNDAKTLRTPPVYEPGETVFLLFEIYGYERKDRMVWIQEDLMVQYPDGSVGLKQENVIDYHQIVKPGGGQIELTNNIALPPNAAPGTYVVTVTLRDMLSKAFTITETQTFTVKTQPSMTSPLEALPPAPAVPVDLYGAPVAGQPPATEVPIGAVPPAPTALPTVPSSPLPVVPAVPGTPAPMPTAGGFTVLPGPAIAPKEEAAPPASIPVPALPPPPATALPADSYGAAPIVKSLPTDPYGTVVPAPSPAPSGIVTKTLTPTVDPYATPAPIVAPVVTPTPAPVASPAAPTPAPTKATPPKAAPPKAAPKKPVATPKVAAPLKPAGTVDEEIKKAADAELKKVAPAKPASEIPSAEEVKKQAPKKKPASSGSSGGYMP